MQKFNLADALYTIHDLKHKMDVKNNEVWYEGKLYKITDVEISTGTKNEPGGPDYV